MMRPRVYGSVCSSAILHNLSVARAHAPSNRLMAVIKKDAYGHGLLRVATLLESAVDGFAVASIEEAIELREASIVKPVCLLSGFYSKEHVALLGAHAIDPVIYCNEQFSLLESARIDHLSVWIKFDTGMNRLGFAVEDYTQTLARARAIKALKITGLMTHFASADDTNSNFTGLQIDRFNKLSADWRGTTSMANSAGILKWPASRAGWIRPGIMLYGVSPFADIPACELNLQPAMDLYSTIIAVKQLSEGDGVGYGLTWKSPGQTTLGIVACGYGDGFHLSGSNSACVLVGDQRARLVGRVSMDSFAIDLGAIPQAGVGTPVKLFGAGLPVETLARACRTLPYEVLTCLNPRTVSLRDA